MIVTIYPSRLKGSILAPASKSSMQRALAAAFLKKGKTIIHNPGHADDDRAATRIIEALGAELDHTAPALIIRSGSIPVYLQEAGKKPLTIDCKESGLSIRMFTPIAALFSNEITITGSGSLVSRPMHFFDEILPQLGVTINTNNGKLPLMIKGPMEPRNIEIDGSISSQFLTGLIMAYTGAAANNVSIKVKNLKSRPYIDLTLTIMKQFGLPIPVNRNYEEFYFSHDPAAIIVDKPATINYVVESDWSGAAFLLVAGAIAGPITVRGLDLSSAQADKAIIDALMSANAGIAMEAKGIKIHPAEMNAFDFDATDCPDLFPPLAALAVYCNGETTIKGVHRLVYKESNRALALKEEFEKMGVRIDLDADLMRIHGKKEPGIARFSSHHDHRIAMACTVVALKAPGACQLENPEAIRKSYPDFFADLKSLGASINIEESGFVDAFIDRT